MGLNRLRAFLRRHRVVALDTSIFIYQLEDHERYRHLTDPIFAWLERPEVAAVTSTITMMELLVQPYRNCSQQHVDEFYGLLSTFPNLQWVAPDLAIADLAARLRARHRLRTPDALQAATAVHMHASGLITNDAVFRRADSFEPLILEDLL